jgi:membrane protein
VDAPVRRKDFAVQIVRRSLAEFADDRCPQLAASIAYHVLFSLFPLAIVAAGATSLVVHATGSRAALVDSIVRNVPLSASGDEQLRHLLLGATSKTAGLGLLGAVGLVYSASGMMAALRVALNAAWDVEDVRPFLKGKLIDLGLVFLVATLAFGSLGLTIALRFADRRASGVPGAGSAAWAVSVAVPLVVGFTVVLFLYRVVPAAEVRLGDAWPAALLVSVLLVAAENLFALYVGHFADYNAVYGSLGAIIAFMFFVYLASELFLLGAEAASEWPRVRAEFARGEVPQAGAPLGEQVRGALRGLWKRGSREDAQAGDDRDRAA